MFASMRNTISPLLVSLQSMGSGVANTAAGRKPSGNTTYCLLFLISPDFLYTVTTYGAAMGAFSHGEAQEMKPQGSLARWLNSGVQTQRQGYHYRLSQVLSCWNLELMPVLWALILCDSSAKRNCVHRTRPRRHASERGELPLSVLNR